MAHREGAPQDWTPNVLVEQRANHNANKAQQAGRQIHPPIRDKDGNLQPHSPWMVHFILEDHGENLKGTEVQITHALAHTHLNYAVPSSNMLVTYGEARKSTYRLLADTEGTAYTVYTWAQYGDLRAPIWHQDTSWHQRHHGRRVPRQGIKPVGSSATSAHGNPSPPNIINFALANARMPLIDTRCPTPDDTTHRRTGASSEGPYTTTWTATKPPGSTKALSPSGLGGWLKPQTPKKCAGWQGPTYYTPCPGAWRTTAQGSVLGIPPAGTPAPTPCSSHCPHSPPHSQVST